MDEITDVVPTSEEIPYSKVNVMSWTMYDIANTVFSMGIVSLTFIHYGLILGLKSGFTYGQSHLLASLSVSLSTLVVALFMPMWGAYADASGKRKPFVVTMGALCILLTGMIFLFEDLLIALSLFIIANITYQWGNLFYDAMIPNIAPPHMTGRVSSFGVALGYGGSIVAIVLNLGAEQVFGSPSDIGLLESLDPGSPLLELGHLRYMFALGALAFLILALPFLLVRERTTPNTKSFKEVSGEAVRELKQTLRNVLGYRDMLLFVIGWFIISDAVNSVITYMKDISVNGLRFSEGEATILLGIGVIGAVVLTYPLGPLADRKGPKFTFYIVGSLWIVATGMFIISDILIPKESLFLAAVLIGPAMGGTWVVQRQMVIELAPPGEVGQYFAFSKFAGKVSASIGPIIFSGVLNLGLEILGLSTTESYRLSVFSLLLFFLAGFLVFSRIQDYHERYARGERAPYN